MVKTILITGASGFIGANLAKELLAKGYVISTILRKNASHPFLNNLPIERNEGDLFSHALLDSAIAQCDTVIHCAALISFDEKDKREIYHVNVTGTENICKYALKHKKKVIFVSTASTMGTPTRNPTLLDERQPFVFKNISSYSHSKYLAEQCVLHYAKKGLDTVIVNPSTVYGAGDLKGTGPSLYRLFSQNPVFFAPPGGSSVIAVQDVVSGVIAALYNGKKGERYILTGENIRYKELFSHVLKICKSREPSLVTIPSIAEGLGCFVLQKIPMKSKTITPTVLHYLFQFRYLDNQKAQKELHWTPTIPIKQALKEGYVFYKEHERYYGQ